MENTSTNKPDRVKEIENELVFSYMTLRNLIGFCGLLLPLILILTTKSKDAVRIIEPSISDYYFTSNGDVLVVLLSILSVFLFTYNGYNWKEKVWTNLAAIGGLGVAFSPTRSMDLINEYSVHTAYPHPSMFLGFDTHILFAALFFISIAILSLVYFPKTSGHITDNKVKRNRVYKICGWMMIGCVVLIAVIIIFKLKPVLFPDFPIVFFLEALAVMAFGISWITKGETLWPDNEHYALKAIREMKANLKESK